MILEVRGHQGFAKKTTRLTDLFTSKNSIKLRYAHLPLLPLTPFLENAIVATGVLGDSYYDIDPQPSFAGVANELNKMMYDGERICYAFYDGFAFEINSTALPLTFSSAFTALLQFPGAMLPDTTLDGNVDGSHTNHFSHYEVIVKQTKGTFNGTGFDNCVARIRRDGTITTTEHFFTGPVLYLEVEIYIVDIGGGSKMLTTTVDWAVGFDFK